MKKWVQKKYQIDLKKIADRYQISEIAAEVLVKRGLFDWNAMDHYLFPDVEAMYEVDKMYGLIPAANLIREKISCHKKIKIIGDYDVDGIMSTYILYKGIEVLGGDVSYRIPHRVYDGYGMRDYMATEAKEEGIDTIVTCDNGISAVEAIEKAKNLGMTVILTDHHEVPKREEEEMLPPADIIVNPKQSKCQYPFKQLCGAGIAYKLIAYLFKIMGKKGQEKEFLAYAAIATVCDVVPLLDENRIIVKNGMEQIKASNNIGLNALIDALECKEKISSGVLGFRIGPCINAAGRLEDAKEGLELLLEKNTQEASKKAAHLLELNEKRKEYTAQATKNAIAKIEGNPNENLNVLVCYIENCHESVAGIVAGRIREKYYRPTLILTDGENGLKGSGRSIPEYHMQQEISKCSSILTEYGGHAMAAGFSLPKENLELFRTQLNQNCQLTQEQLTEKVYFDREADLMEFDESIIKQLDYMEPFGQDNAKAVFAKREIEIASLSLCGKEKQIARVTLREGIRTYNGVDFQCELHLGEAVRKRYGEEKWNQMKQGNVYGCVVDILYFPEINQKYGGIQFQIVDCR